MSLNKNGRDKMSKHFENENNGTRLSQVDGFRFLLCFLIVLYHLCIRYFEVRNNSNIANNFLPDAFSVYGCFLFISGYFCRPFDIKTATKKRLVSLIIPYWICISILLVFLLLDNGTISIIDVLMNYLLFPMIIGKFIYIDGAHWYVVYLLYFYIFMLILNALSKHVKFKYFKISVLFLCLFGSFAFEMFGNLNRLFSLISIVFNKRFFAFLVGAIFFECKNYSKKNLLCIAFISFLLLSIILIKMSIFSFILSSFLYLLLLLCFRNKIAFFENNILCFIGKKTLWIYLLHETMGFVLIDWLSMVSGNMTFSIIITIFITILLAILIGTLYSFIVHKVVNKRNKI